ncbi:MAG TPA: threonylcarbamoyl-AMP synthase [Nitrospinaceae bacterium]|jgi:L-threonylcarbamoyladenylate synthase|nr:threonylcarbamoyl-AMP synthase [Nitrospinaceae bacterium]HIK57982.1 threonylcarbamoyl-AMP synthase [Nitrospinaceae bacterium]
MPQILKVDSSTEDVSAIARKVLFAGGVLAFPTDTFYGLGVDPFNQAAVNKLFKLKNREKNKPLILLISSKEELKALVKEITPAHATLMQKFWPGPLTLLFEPNPVVPQNVLAGSNRIGIRQPGNALTQKLISALGQAITAPSANISGENPPTTAQQVHNSFGSCLDLIIDGGTCQGGKPSTLVDAVEMPVQLIREGSIPFSEIESAIEKNISHPEVLR